MIRTVRKILAALCALALVAVGTPSTAQTVRPLTAQERAARGLDMVRYCAPQIAALGRISKTPKLDADSIGRMLGGDNPRDVAGAFASTLAELTYGNPPEHRASPEVALCLSGRAMALDADRMDALGWITIRNMSAADVSFESLAGGSCWARKNGGFCTMQVIAGSHPIRASHTTVIDVGEVLVAPGQQSVVVYGGR